MLSRRTIVAGLGLSLLLPPSFAEQGSEAQAHANLEDDPFPSLSAARSNLESLPDKVLPKGGLKQVGSAEADDIDYEVANALCALAPFACLPIDVAMYWRNIGQGTLVDLGSERLNARLGPDFARGWAIKANPVIINFFAATATNPMGASGDATPWCAAFMNWCIARSQSNAESSGVGKGKQPGSFSRDELRAGTRSASSGSFRCWGEEAEEPEYGDICVWALKGTVDGCRHGRGHVGFWAGLRNDGRVHLLGGNQRDHTTIEGTKQHSINMKGFGKTYFGSRSSASKIVKDQYDLITVRTSSILRSL